MREAFVLEEEIETLRKWIIESHKPGEIRELGNVMLFANSTGGLSAIHLKSEKNKIIEIESISMEGKIITYTTIGDTYQIRILTLEDLKERHKKYEERVAYRCCCTDF